MGPPRRSAPGCAARARWGRAAAAPRGDRGRERPAERAAAPSPGAGEGSAGQAEQGARANNHGWTPDPAAHGSVPGERKSRRGRPSARPPAGLAAPRRSGSDRPAGEGPLCPKNRGTRRIRGSLRCRSARRAQAAALPPSGEGLWDESETPRSAGSPGPGAVAPRRCAAGRAHGRGSAAGLRESRAAFLFALLLFLLSPPTHSALREGGRGRKKQPRGKAAGQQTN